MKSLAMKYPGLACLSLRKPKLATQLFLKKGIGDFLNGRAHRKDKSKLSPKHKEWCNSY